MHPNDNAAVAGISAGLVAGAVLIGLAALFLWRRKKQGKPVFARSSSQRSGPYPEVAWLYDPVMTPNGSPGHSRSGSMVGENDALQPGMAMTSPNLRPVSESGPLLAPPRSMSPSPGRARAWSGGSRDESLDVRRPLSGVDEEQGP